MASRDPGLPLDIHFGGADLAYPHHESELLLADALGLGEYCRLWMHNGLMEDADGKLSKSREERLSLAAIFDDCPPAALRFYLLQYHYRDFTPFSETALKAACAEGEQLGWTAAEVLTADGGDPDGGARDENPHGDAQLARGDPPAAALLARIEALLRRSQGAPKPASETYEFGAVRVDLRGTRVFRGEEELSLSAKEFQLLQYLIEHRGETLARDKLLQEVWGYQSAPSTRTVDVHVAWLRQKIEPDLKKPRWIVTVHGLGYRFAG